MVDTHKVLAIHDELRMEVEHAQNKLQSFVRFMDAAGVTRNIVEIGPNGRSDHNGIPDGESYEELATEHEADVNAGMKGLTVPEALIFYAQMHGNKLNCTKAARALLAAGVGDYASVSSAVGSFYYHLKRDPRWARSAPGEFTFHPGNPLTRKKR